MRIKNIKRLGKPVRENILYQSSLPIRITWMSGKITGPPFLAYHPEFEFHYIKRGEGAYLIENQNYPFHKNSLLVIRPHEIHCFTYRPGTYLEKGSLIFSTSLVKDQPWLTRFGRSFPHLLQLSEREATMVEIIIKEICEETQRKEKYWQELISQKLKEFLVLVKRAGVQNPQPHQTNPKISRIITYIKENFSRSITRGIIADEFALSPGYLSRLFKKDAGMNLKQYILQRRIVEAKRLLTEQPTLKVRLIPQKVGFKDFALFNRSFKLITGLTPSAYRIISHQDNE